MPLFGSNKKRTAIFWWQFLYIRLSFPESLGESGESFSWFSRDVRLSVPISGGAPSLRSVPMPVIGYLKSRVVAVRDALDR